MFVCVCVCTDRFFTRGCRTAREGKYDSNSGDDRAAAEEMDSLAAPP